MQAAVIAIKAVEKRMPAARKHSASCSTCTLRELCLPAGLEPEDLARIDNVVYARKRVKRGEALYQAGADFNALYAIRSGSFKTSLFDADGHEQVSGFFMGGELLGLEGLGAGTYNAAAVALEDSEVCVLPYALIEELAREVPALQRGHLRPDRGACARGSGAAARAPRGARTRNRARPGRDDAPRNHALRAAPRDVPAQSLGALA